MLLAYVRRHSLPGHHYVAYSTIEVPENQVDAFIRAWRAEFNVWVI